MATTSGNAAGFDRIQYAVSSSGIPTDFASLSVDAGAGMTRLFAAQAADVSLPAGDTVNIPGDDGTDAQFLFDPIELEQFALTLGRNNYAFINQLQGTTNIDLQSTFTMLMRNPKGRDFTDIFFLLSRRANKRNGTTGAGYEHVVVPLATGQYLGSAFATREGGAYNYNVTANFVQQTFWGNALGAGANEVGDKDEAPSFEFYSDYPMTIDVYKSNGSATSYTPNQTFRTGGTVLAWDAGDLALATVPTTLAITESSGNFTFTAPGSGDYIVFLYEVAE